MRTRKEKLNELKDFENYKLQGLLYIKGGTGGDDPGPGDKEDDEEEEISFIDALLHALNL